MYIPATKNVTKSSTRSSKSAFFSVAAVKSEAAVTTDTRSRINNYVDHMENSHVSSLVIFKMCVRMSLGTCSPFLMASILF